MKASEKRVTEIGEYREEHTSEETEKHFNVSKGTVKRYYTYYKDMIGTIERNNAHNITIKKLLERYTPQELKAIAEGKRVDPTQRNYPIIDFDGDEVVFGYCTDTHMGSKYFDEHLWDMFVEECYKQDVNSILHSGDITEGLSNRPDHAYSLTHYGYDAQKEYAISLLSQIDKDIYCIDGNHDRWFLKSNGAIIVKDICESVPNAHFLGHDEADIDVKGTKWRLWHGEDGSSYATSYRLQKIVESFTGGDKPNVMLCGHTHKSISMFDRNVHVISGGALSLQSRWMRSKKLANHTGFWIIRAVISDSTIKQFTPTWYPFYM